MQGAHDIKSYCLGHTSFVTCATFVKGPQGTVLVSGGGDGTIRYRRLLSQWHTCKQYLFMRTNLGHDQALADTS